VAAAHRADGDAPLPGLADLPDQVAAIARARVAPDDLGVERLEFLDGELGELGLPCRGFGLGLGGLGLLLDCNSRLGGVLLLGLESLGDAAQQELLVRRPRGLELIEGSVDVAGGADDHGFVLGPTMPRSR
jgi:hypothetical protein